MPSIHTDENDEMIMIRLHSMTNDNDASMNDSKVESPRLSELEKIFYAPLVDKSKSYVHKSDEGSEPSHELIIPEEMEEACNDSSMNDSKLESSRLSEQEKLFYDSNKFQCSERKFRHSESWHFW